MLAQLKAAILFFLFFFFLKGIGIESRREGWKLEFFLVGRMRRRMKIKRKEKDVDRVKTLEALFFKKLSRINFHSSSSLSPSLPLNEPEVDHSKGNHERVPMTLSIIKLVSFLNFFFLSPFFNALKLNFSLKVNLKRSNSFNLFKQFQSISLSFLYYNLYYIFFKVPTLYWLWVIEWH